VSHRSTISVKVFDAPGRHVETLLDRDRLEVGNYACHWNASGVAGGIYFARIENGTTAGVIKLTLMK
jgi:hypothetical protein